MRLQEYNSLDTDSIRKLKPKEENQFYFKLSKQWNRTNTQCLNSNNTIFTDRYLSSKLSSKLFKANLEIAKPQIQKLKQRVKVNNEHH